ncbi:ribosome-associated translation inhibitor RaiA [Candidatus Saccharibacteria bacterium]|nr:ribosome-associated translation inhibitor RaiA [Candidatus Saccharibacteria bacterium]
MITHIDIAGVKYSLDETTKKYVNKKIGRLDRYLPKKDRDGVRAEVKLKEVNRDHGNKYECEVLLFVPDKTLMAKDTTVNMLAAVDIVEEKLKNQLKKYKSERTNHRGRHDLLGKMKRSFRRG